MVGRRFLLLLFAATFAVIVTAGCQRFQRDEPVAAPTPIPTVAPAPTSTSTPTATETPSPTATPSAGTEFIEGRPYIRRPLQGAILRYEAWVDYSVVRQVEEAYAVARRILLEELGVAEVPPVDIYLSLANETVRFAEDRNFQHPAWLGGFYYYLIREGEVVDAEVFVNASAGSIPHTVGHELTHLTTPAAPHWLSEGIAEYIGSRAGTALEPGSEEQRVLQTRHTVRAATADTTLLSFQELAQFEWNAIEDFRTLELVYAETWHLMEYIARTFGTASLFELLAQYDDGLSEAEDPFQSTLGLSAEALWSEFTADITESLLEAERVGLRICSLTDMRERSLALTGEWNRFASLAIALDSPQALEQLQAFGQGWTALLDESVALEALEEAVAIRDLTAGYFRIMAQAMDYFLQGEVSEANDALTLGSAYAHRRSAALEEALFQRPWLTC